MIAARRRLNLGDRQPLVGHPVRPRRVRGLQQAPRPPDRRRRPARVQQAPARALPGQRPGRPLWRRGVRGGPRRHESRRRVPDRRGGSNGVRRADGPGLLGPAALGDRLGRLRRARAGATAWPSCWAPATSAWRWPRAPVATRSWRPDGSPAPETRSPKYRVWSGGSTTRMRMLWNGERGGSTFATPELIREARWIRVDRPAARARRRDRLPAGAPPRPLRCSRDRRALVYGTSRTASSPNHRRDHPVIVTGIVVAHPRRPSGCTSITVNLQTLRSDYNPIVWIVFAIIGLAISGGYFIYTWTKRRATIGMQVLGMQVGDAGTGATLTQDQAIKRWLALGAPLCDARRSIALPAARHPDRAGRPRLGRSTCVYTTNLSPTKQGWHDVFAHSRWSRSTGLIG